MRFFLKKELDEFRNLTPEELKKYRIYKEISGGSHGSAVLYIAGGKGICPDGVNVRQCTELKFCHIHEKLGLSSEDTVIIPEKGNLQNWELPQSDYDELPSISIGHCKLNI